MRAVNDPRARIMAQLRNKFHKHNQCLFWVGPLLDDLNLECYEDTDSKGNVTDKLFPAMGRGTFNDVIDQLVQEGICRWEADFECEECGWGWRGNPQKQSVRCQGCGVEFEPSDRLQFVVLDRPWAEARRWQ